jgi:hypothetical protein
MFKKKIESLRTNIKILGFSLCGMLFVIFFRPHKRNGRTGECAKKFSVKIWGFNETSEGFIGPWDSRA